jgi:hypothetical protein
VSPCNNASFVRHYPCRRVGVKAQRCADEIRRDTVLCQSPRLIDAVDKVESCSQINEHSHHRVLRVLPADLKDSADGRFMLKTATIDTIIRLLRSQAYSCRRARFPSRAGSRRFTPGPGRIVPPASTEVGCSGAELAMRVRVGRLKKSMAGADPLRRLPADRDQVAFDIPRGIRKPGSTGMYGRE